MCGATKSIEPIAAVTRSLGEKFVLIFHLERGMTGRIWLAPFIAFACILGSTAAFAQSVGADEAVTSYGAVIQKLGLTPVQKSAIYNAVVQQRVRASTTQIEPTVGAPVSRSVQLAELPRQAEIDGALSLKYAMVADDVIIVDPIRLRVVDIIHGSTSP